MHPNNVHKKRLAEAKSKIQTEDSASKALEHVYEVITSPERLYTVFIKTKSAFHVLNFFEKNRRISSFVTDEKRVYLEPVVSRDDLSNFVANQLGETTPEGTVLQMSLGFIEFLTLASASALSRTSSKNQIVNLLGEGSFTKDDVVSKFSVSEKLVLGFNSQKASTISRDEIVKALNSLISKGILRTSKEKLDETITVNENFTEITNVLGSPDLLVVVCISDFGSGLRCFSFVKSWDNELVSIVANENQTMDSSVTVERHFSSDLKEYIQNRLYNLPNKVTKPDSLEKGQELIQAGNFNEAVKVFHEALRLTPKDYDVWYWLGVTYHRMNLLFDAVRCYNKAVNLNSKSAKAWFDLGCAHYQMKEYPEAAKCFRRITEINPQPHDAWFWAGLSYGNCGEFGLASNYLSEAAQRKPDDPQIWYSLGQASVEVLNQSKNKAEAKRMAKSTLQYFKNAEEKGIKEIISKENYSHFKLQLKQLVEFLAN